MKLIVGLGNPGVKYKNNRHNVGFLFIDYLLENLQIPNPKSQDPNKFKNDKYLMSEILRLEYDRSEIVLSKPFTFMNLSGAAVKKLLENWKLKVENLIIVHDDLDIPLGKFKIDMGRGPKMHNGIASIEQHLKTSNFWRIRIGVDNRPAYIKTSAGEADRFISGETYVLQNFRPEEKKILKELFPKIIATLWQPGRLT